MDGQEAKTMLAARLYEKGALSLGQAAVLAGYSKTAFMEVLQHDGVYLLNSSEAELENDISNAENYHS